MGFLLHFGGKVYRKAVLDNGIRVVMERIGSVHSVSLGIWVRVGSRNETPALNGISHFIEHMFFKGTAKRSAKDIAVDIDSVGGDINAFTSKEGTTFYIKVLDEFLENGIELLSDIFLHSTFPEAEIEKEKGVIKEEIKMVEDAPDDYVHDLFSEAVWGDSGLGQPILGRRNTVKGFTRDDLVGHIKKYYGTRDIVIACAGNFEPEELIASLNRHLGGLRRGSEPKQETPSGFMAGVNVHERDYAEAHICLGVQGMPQGSPDRYALSTVNTIFGAGISSILFQEIREKRGLVYAIQSFTASYLDTGLWAVYAGTGRKKVVEVAELVLKEFRGLKDSVTPAVLERAKKQIKGNLILGLESTSSRMQNLARQEIYYGRHYSIEEIMREIDSLTLGAVRELAERLSGVPAIAITVLGPVEKAKTSALLSAL